MTTTVTATPKKRRIEFRAWIIKIRYRTNEEKSDVDDIGKGFGLISSLTTTNERRKNRVRKLVVEWISLPVE